MPQHNQKGRSRTDGKFVQLFEWMLKSPAYRSLSVYSRSLLTEIKRRYNGENNGEISLSVREAAALIPCAKNTAMKAFRELEKKGFIKSKQKGGFDYKQRHATTWILTEYKYGEKGPTKDFMSWQEGAEIYHEKNQRYHEVRRTVSRHTTVRF